MKIKNLESGLSESAYFMIREAILRGKLPMGAALSRRKLANQFHMSLLPIGEALQRLEMEGLVESRPRVGTRVKIPNAQDIRGHYVVREALECQAARLFAEKASASEQLEVQGMAAELDAFDSEQFSKNEELGEDRVFDARVRHHRFHMRITECTGCQALIDAIEKNHILMFHWLPDPMANRLDCRPYPSRRWHQDLVDALLTGDPLEADKTMRQHIWQGMERLLAQLEPYIRGLESHVHTWSRRSRTYTNAGEDREGRPVGRGDSRPLVEHQEGGSPDHSDETATTTTTGEAMAERVSGVADTEAKGS